MKWWRFSTASSPHCLHRLATTGHGRRLRSTRKYCTGILVALGAGRSACWELIDSARYELNQWISKPPQ